MSAVVPPRNESLNQQILEEAASWLIEFNDGELDLGQRGAFNHWIRRSPEHVRAYLEIYAAFEVSSKLDSQRQLDPRTLIREALAESNVVSLMPATADRALREKPISNVAVPPAGLHAAGTKTAVRSRYIAVAASALIVGAMAAWYGIQRNSYSTDIGEQRSILLVDGSTIQLNSRSKLRVDFSAKERVVNLLEGQALFEVRKDVHRPFIVRTGTTRVRAVGTQFDVYRKRSGTTVTVVDGRVTVSPLQLGPAQGHSVPNRLANRVPAATGPLVLSAGQQVTVVREGVPQPVPVNVVNATAWTQHKIVFEETTLAEAVEEFNRYNVKRLVIDDPALASFHIRGTFFAFHPETLAQFLRQRFALSVTESATEIRISAAAVTR